ncbi:hypothetical protein RM697_04690 [Ichthyenterobacterium sp. W332]|uniref:Lipoprotein n=1 Tax=Microcosmobacter mediterraneus TaxID=3075607 RepID=A0ABU2YIC8_9FLAO|nr:hypothetical protein [Ichthyenterobacterium sp. W332]MDT0557930.1 hypothetical protein [Ichthyenterobacterium sp. W332]
MKYLLLILPFTIALSCNSVKKNMNSKDSITKIVTTCPEDGICSFKTTSNKSFKILKDEFNSTYPSIKDGDNLLLEFQYERNKIPNVADSGYIEQVFIELNTNDIPENLVDENLQNVKLSFARLCFCRGQTGYYKITEGNLNIEKINDKIFNLNLEFTCNEVPQVITKINETFTIEY